MRLFITLLILAVVIAAYFYRTDYEDYLVKGLSEIRQLFVGETGEGKKTTIYKVRDAEGNWVYTNEPPADNNAEQLEYDSAANVIPSVKHTEKPNSEQPETKKPQDSTQPSGSTSTLPFPTPGQAMQTYKDAKQIEQKLQQRKIEMDQRIEQQR